MSEIQPVDQAARDRIAADLDRTLFVEAGAGSGKTTALVERVVALIMDGGVPMSGIAAITFTEKAAAELRDRIRQALERRAEDGEDLLALGASREVAGRALDELDAAAVGTLHSFAQRLLREHPVEAGLPPRLEILDEIGSSLAFEARWDRLRRALLDDDELRSSLELLEAGGALRLDQLRIVIRTLDDNWDLVADGRVPDAWADPPPPPTVAPVLGMIDDVARLTDGCTDADDKLLPACVLVGELGRSLEAAADAIESLEALADLAGLKRVHVGKAANWPDVGEVRDVLKALKVEAERAMERTLLAAGQHLVHHLGIEVLRAAEQRRAEGRLDFHDLLVLARRLLRHPDHGDEVRRRLSERYPRLLLDEFQDTDPIQLELAALIALPPEDGDDWRTADVRPGGLFVVGDPKQSIYRFRRADISLFLEARSRLIAADDVLALTTNFRSSAPVIDWVNRVFGQLVQPAEGSQPAYEPLSRWRGAPGRGAGVALLGVDPHTEALSADELRRVEAADVAAAAVTVRRDGWSVDDGHGGERQATYGDICVLVPSRLSLGALENALEEAGVPYRTESSSLLYASDEVRDLLAAVRAVDDPTDELSLITALRSPLFGCSDVDLADWRLTHGGSWNHQAPVPNRIPGDHPVADAMIALGELHRRRTWVAPSEIIGALLRDRRAFELAAGRRRSRDVWRRFRFVVDQAREFSTSTGGTLRDYLEWVRFQSSDQARVAEAVLPETDDDAVRIMTIHAAKGLEFPVTILSGMTTKRQGRTEPVRVVFPPRGTCGLRLRGVTNPEFDAFVPIDEQMDHQERIRLLYVAATRARDHLIVSLHRMAHDVKDPNRGTHAELLAGLGFDADDDARRFDPPPATADDDAPVAGGPEPMERAQWAAVIDEVRSARARRSTVSATAVATAGQPATVEDPGLAKGARDLELPPWYRGRYGTAVGRAVHAVLQTVDLGTGDGLDHAVAAQSAAEGVSRLSHVVRDLVRSALAHPLVAEAAAAPHWRETYVAAPVGDRLLEGYVDLLYRTPAGLVVVDHKTDAVPRDDLDLLVARYRLQAAAYARAVASATGETVVRAVLLFLHPDGADARDVPDLRSAIDEVERVAVTL